MIFDVFLEGHCAKDEYRLCFFWVGGWVIFLQQRLLNELQANFFRELIFWRRYVLANRPLFAFFGLCSFVENFKGSVGTANRQATQKKHANHVAGACKAKVLLHFAAMGLHPKHVLFSFGVALDRNLVCKKRQMGFRQKDRCYF
jgi:hypothetical protein